MSQPYYELTLFTRGGAATKHRVSLGQSLQVFFEESGFVMTTGMTLEFIRPDPSPRHETSNAGILRYSELA